MKKDNLVFGLAGIVIGIILGVLIGNASVGPQEVAEAAPPAAQQNQNASQQQALPDGHPPIDTAALEQQLTQYKAQLYAEPQNQQALVAAANLCYDLKKFQEATGYYEQALVKDPNNLNLITDLGTSYFYSNNPAKAVEAYTRVQSIEPGHMQSLMNMGIVKMSMGDHNGAAEAWETLVAKHPDHPEAARLKQSIAELRAAKQ